MIHILLNLILVCRSKGSNSEEGSLKSENVDLKKDYQTLSDLFYFFELHVFQTFYFQIIYF